MLYYRNPVIVDDYKLWCLLGIASQFARDGDSKLERLSGLELSMPFVASLVDGRGLEVWMGSDIGSRRIKGIVCVVRALCGAVASTVVGRFGSAELVYM